MKRKIKVIGPDKFASQLEGSKAFMKNLCKENNIPTANFWTVSSINEAKKIISEAPEPLVVKADGLASGKGVFIPETKKESLEAVKEIFNGKFGKAGQIVVLEERILPLARSVHPLGLCPQCIRLFQETFYLV